MGSIRIDKKGKEYHWADAVREFVVKRFVKIKQPNTMLGQRSLPGMDGEAERSLHFSQLEKHKKLLKKKRKKKKKS